MCFVKCGVGLEGKHNVFGRVDDGAVECDERFAYAFLSQMRRNLFEIAVEPHAEEFILVPAGVQECPKISRHVVLYCKPSGALLPVASDGPKGRGQTRRP